MAKIHPTAIVDKRAKLADDVEIGPGSVVEADVKIGPGTVLRQNVIVRRYTTLGANNIVDAFTVLGGEPQDLKFDPNTVSYLRIGDGNVFREHVTISRATGEGNATVVGNKTYWMVGSHAGHNATVHDEAILVNGSALAGHSELGAKSILSAHVVIHQFTWVGTMVMSQGNGATSMHVPPYTIFAGANYVVGLNSVGLRRAPHISNEDRRQIKEAFALTYRSGLTPVKALEKMDACSDWGQAADKFRQFVRRVVTAQKPYNRGLIRLRSRNANDEEIAS
jgi:UDP-N-acetylglucosamine acyltransferase